MSWSDRRVRRRSAAAFIAAAIGLATTVFAAAHARAAREDGPGADWIGQRVVQTARDFFLRDDRQSVVRGSRIIVVYRVMKADGARLWLEAEGHPAIPDGWAKAAEVVPLHRAAAFFTERIRANPEDGFSCLMRAAIRTGAIERRRDPLDVAFPRDPFAGPDLAIRNGRPHAEEPVVDDLRLSPAGPNAALDDFTTAIRVDPKSASARRGRGLIRVRRKEYDRAIADFDEAVRLEPWNPVGHHGRATARLGKGDLDGALSDLDRSLQLDAMNAAYYQERANVLFDKREYDRAIADCGRVIRIDPEYPDAYLIRGLAWRDERRLDKALADFDEAIRLRPQDAYAHYFRSVVAFAMRRDGPASEAKAILDIQGWDGDLALDAVLLGCCALRRAGQTEQARSLLDEAKLRCHAAAWPAPIIRYLRGELDEAGLMAAAEADGDPVEAHGFLGLEAPRAGREEEAMEHFRWVKEQGDPAGTQTVIAAAELDRLRAKGAEGDGP